MQIGSQPPRPSPREAGGGRGGGERGRGRGPGGSGEERGSGARRPPALRPAQGAAGRVRSPPSGLWRAGTPRLPKLPRPLLLLLSPPPPAAGMCSSLASILRAPRPTRSPGRPPTPPPGLPPPSGAELPRGGLPGVAELHSDTGVGLAASAAGPGAPRVRAARCTCSSAGPQPTLGQHSLGETNPSAARRASGRARLAPRRRRPSQTPASCAAAAASPGPGGSGRTGLLRLPGPSTRREGNATSRSGFEIAPSRRSPVALGELKRETASEISGAPYPNTAALGVSGCRVGAV